LKQEEEVLVAEERTWRTLSVKKNSRTNPGKKKENAGEPCRGTRNQKQGFPAKKKTMKSDQPLEKGGGSHHPTSCKTLGGPKRIGRNATELSRGRKKGKGRTKPCRREKSQLPRSSRMRAHRAGCEKERKLKIEEVHAQTAGGKGPKLGGTTTNIPKKK